jgi:hypothetical protein
METLNVICLGVSRTGTRSLELAIDQLSLGPCHHINEVILHRDVQVPLWEDALKGEADWEAIYKGYNSAVGSSTAAFFRELVAAFPMAKFILTVRNPDSWVPSFSKTVYKLPDQRSHAHQDAQRFLEMVVGILDKTGFIPGLNEDGLKKAFIAHNEAVKAIVPPDQLLVFEAKEGWGPICKFLDVPVPDVPFPSANTQDEFWERIGRMTKNLDRES